MFETTRPPKYERWAPVGADSALIWLGLSSACPCCSGSIARDGRAAELTAPISLAPPASLGPLQPVVVASVSATIIEHEARPDTKREAKFFTRPPPPKLWAIRTTGSVKETRSECSGSKICRRVDGDCAVRPLTWVALRDLSVSRSRRRQTRTR